MQMNSYKYYQHDGRISVSKQEKEDKSNKDANLFFII
jgi:hypothetical protein